MFIKSTPQLLKRISIRWLPDDAYEDTETFALNVGGYFLDVRVLKNDKSLQWARAGERINSGEELSTCRWTRIVDSTGSSQTDEAEFRILENGDGLEFGTFLQDQIPLPYEEIWRDVTPRPVGENVYAWILQSEDGQSFVGKLGDVFMAMQQDKKGFSVRRETFDVSAGLWTVDVEHGGAQDRLPKAGDILEAVEKQIPEKSVVKVDGVDYVIRALDRLSESN